MITFVFIKIVRGLKMIEMWYGGILQLKPIVWAVEMKATRILEIIRAGNKPGSVLTTDVSRDHSSGTAVTDSL